MARFDLKRTATKVRALFTSLVLVIAFGGVVAAGQKTPTTLWYYPNDGYEKGNISELKDKHRVFVAFFDGGTSPQEPQRVSYQQRIRHELTRENTLEVVETPEQADLAIYIRSHSNGGAADYDFFVLTRGERQKDGGYRPRMIAKKLRSDSKDSTALIEQAVSTFVDDLRSARGLK